jgi:transposase-like protein
MRQLRPPESSLTMIERPRCPKCQIRMMLVGVELSFAGPDLRTFKCPKCELDYKALA